MAVYKIPQDVEADDKFVGPLSFKQFIFVGIASIAAYLSFLSLVKGFWPALILFLPIIVVAGFLGFPWGREQPTEIWLAARIRFLIKPRKRIWNQDGMKELVTITVPKKVDKHYTDGLSQNEVKSRLSGLADLLDSRGWAVKNIEASDVYTPAYTFGQDHDDSRLLDVEALPKQVTEASTTVDVLDETQNPTAINFEQLIKTSEQKHHSDVVEKLAQMRNELNIPDANDTANGSNPADFWVLQQEQSAIDTAAKPANSHQKPAGASLAPPEQITPPLATFSAPSVVAPHAEGTGDPAPVGLEANQVVSEQQQQALLEKVHKQQSASVNPYGHLKTIAPINTEDPASQMASSAQTAQQADLSTQSAANDPASQVPMPAVTPPVNPAIMNLSNNDDLSVETLARQAKKQASDDSNEVVISLR